MKDANSQIQKQIVWVIFALGAILLLGGLIAVFLRLEGQTEVTFFGQKLSSAVVGVVLVFIGAVMVVITIRNVLRSLGRDSASVPNPPPTQTAQATNPPPTQTAQATGGIDQPHPGDTIERSAECAGWAKNVQPTEHLWLVVEAGRHLWPKEGELHLTGNNLWRTKIFEDGASQRFALSLYIANRDGHQQILDWLEAGKRTGTYAELTGLPGTRRLARIDKLNVRP